MVDNANKPVGFIVDNQFIALALIPEHIAKIQNLKILEGGLIQSDDALPEVSYHEAVIDAAYQRLVEDNPFERDIQLELKAWKKTWYKKVLQLGGSRQIGKTTELLKFAYQNYENIIYVNLADDVYNFKDLLKSGIIRLDMQTYCERANLPVYEDNRTTILILDEIQSSKEAYNSIRSLRAALKCDIAITESYLGVVFSTEGFFLPAGTIMYVDMRAMNFREFAGVFGQSELLDNIDLFGSGSQEQYDKLKSLYEIYRQIGGYPEVVKAYIQTKSIDQCYPVISDLLRIFKEESRNYFGQPRDVEIFESVYSAALYEMCREKRGTGKDQVEIITRLSKDNTDLIVNKNEIANAIMWLIYTGIISTCDLAVNGDVRTISKDRRLYFSDCGIVSFLIKKTFIDQSSAQGLLTETFVFNELKHLFKDGCTNKKVALDNVCFSVYNNYELDFIIASAEKVIYGIEVKTNGGNPLSLKIFIDRGFIDRGIVAKPSNGGHGDQYDTIPIYTVACRFPYE